MEGELNQTLRWATDNRHPRQGEINTRWTAAAVLARGATPSSAVTYLVPCLREKLAKQKGACLYHIPPYRSVCLHVSNARCPRENPPTGLCQVLFALGIDVVTHVPAQDLADVMPLFAHTDKHAYYSTTVTIYYYLI